MSYTTKRAEPGDVVILFGSAQYLMLHDRRLVNLKFPGDLISEFVSGRCHREIAGRPVRMADVLKESQNWQRMKALSKELAP